jgi:hypothetical protein
MAQASVHTPTPKPDAEVENLHVLVGHWTYEGEIKQPGPWGCGGKVIGEMTRQMILGGFFLQCQISQKIAESEMQALQIIGYDPLNKNFVAESYLSDGARLSKLLTITGNTWNFAERLVKGGKTVPVQSDRCANARLGERNPQG